MLTAAQNKVLEIELRDKVHTNSEIARRLGISSQRVGVIRRKAEYQRALCLPISVQENIQRKVQANKELRKIERIKEEIMYEKVARELDPVIKVWKEGALPAAMKIVDLSQNSSEENIQFAASKEVVNQAGYVPEKKVTTMSVELTGPDAERISRSFTLSQTRTREIGTDN